MNSRGVGDRATRAAASGENDTLATAQRISDLIGAIYDCALNPQNWQATLEEIARELSFASAALGVLPLRPGAQVLNVGVGFDSEWLRIVDDDTYRAASVDLWGGAERLQRFPLDEPIVASQLPGYAERHANRYFRDILEPRGIFDSVATSLANGPSLFGYIAFNRHVSNGDIRESEVRALRLLGPHFRRAVTISNLFDMKAIEAKTFASALDAMSAGVVLVDESLGIVHANEAAQAMLAAREPIRSERGILVLRSEGANAALEAAVRHAASDEAAMGQKGIGIPARRSNGEPCVIHLLPLRRGELRRSLAERAAAALFVAPASSPPRMPMDALALLYDLTPAESRVFELVCEGVTQEMIGATLGIARSTVKTHLLHVFDKTGCKRQADLVRLAASLSLPV